MKLINLKRSAYQTSVVTRLRATFLFLTLVSCSATAFGVWQLSSLDRSHAQLVGSAVPTLRHTHELQGELAAVLGLAARAAEGQSYKELKALQNQLNEKTYSIRRAIESEKWPQHTLHTRNQIAGLLDALQAIQQSGVALRVQILSTEDSLREHWEGLRQTRAAFRELVEPLLIDSAAKLELADRQSNRLDSFDERLNRAAVSKLIIKQMNLTQLGYRFSALIDTAENQLGDEFSKSVKDLAKRLRFEFSGVMQVLIRLPAGTERKTLATELSNTRDLLFSNTGIVDLLRSRVATAADVEQSDNKRLAVVASINSHADELVASASDDADQAAVDFQDYLNGTLTVMAITIIIVLLVLGAVWLLVVERQISRRMSLLTDTVSAIADGDIDTPVDVNGHDELSKMGSALEIFKSNATELRRSNEELESFAYAAAHDMRSPLRAIESLAQWTLEDAGDKLPAGCRVNLEKLLSRANRLSKLQADLLDYSRVGKADSDQRPLDLRTMICNIHDLLDADEKFIFEIDVPQAYVEVPETPIRQILINLITNAIKHHDQENGVIGIKADVKDNRLVVAVSDDGPGIEPAFHERIFKLFQTLQSRDVVEGSGLGLSFVLRQVNRFGGEIRVLSDPSLGRGATFIFDLPARMLDNAFVDTTPFYADTGQEPAAESASS